MNAPLLLPVQPQAPVITVDPIEGFALTPSQQTAMDAFWAFIADPLGAVFILKGYSGCGKSTLVRTLLNELPNYIKTVRLIDPKAPAFDLHLTATTNKAAENLEQIANYRCETIHSFLGLMVRTDFETGETKLIPKASAGMVENCILFIDEASYIDKQLLGFIFQLTRNCKVVFVGDPAQLTPVKSNNAPVFELPYPTAELTEVVRQAAGNPILALATEFRHTVNTGTWPVFKPDGHHIQHLSRADFDAKLLAEMGRPHWKYSDSKFLAWTNKRVIHYNNMVRSHVKGTPDFQIGDYAIVNSFVSGGKGGSLKTDQTVHITNISPGLQRLGVHGREFQVNGGTSYFMPDSLDAKNARAKEAKANNAIHELVEIDTWIDLRAAYAQTVNKAQGSTYDTVFVDLDDISRCNMGNQIARMLYVGVSRARHHVYLTGDLV